MRKRAVILTAVLVILLGAAAAVMLHWRVDRVIVQGSTRYTDEEIERFVMKGPLGHNSLYLSLRYRDRETDDIAFIDRIDTEILDPHTARIRVYEKALAGYIRYLGRNLYFDREGTVVESTMETADGIPQVTGLDIDHIVLYEKLPVKDPAVFRRILDISQLMTKYSVTADKIFFDSSGNMTLYFGKIRVQMGQDVYTDEKMSNLSHIIPVIEGKEGSIDLTGYTPDSRYTTFTEKNANTD